MNDDQLVVATKRYFKDNEKIWSDCATRVGSSVAAFTINPAVYTDKFIGMINDMLFMPGGRILRNAGLERGSVFQCYHLPIGDSREEIGECFKNALILWGEGGGVGINFSTLRPKGSIIRGVGGFSSGSVSFMRALDAIASTVESGGQRRAASLGLLEVWHPDLYDFIRAKHTDGVITYFNISVGITHDFIEAVQRGDSWKLHWMQRESRTVDAQEIWSNIIEGMVTNGEPGLINMSNLRVNNSWYFAPISGTNPCGEACLEVNGVCDLGSIVLPKFVTAAGRIKWAMMEEVIKDAVRFLDCCIDLNRFTLDPIRQTAQRARRIGLGVMGFADMLFAMGIPYGSRDALDVAERLFKFIRNVSYQQSVALATEKGAFPAYDSFHYCKSKFIRTLPPSLRRDIRHHGMRNVTVNAIAPTGTISLVAGTTSGIEPLFAKAYERRDRVSTRTYVHPMYCDALRSGSVPEWLVDCGDLEPIHHIETQAVVQKYIDGAVSKTINLPRDYKSGDLRDLLLESIFDLKGVTVYREGSRGEEPLVRLDGEIAGDIVHTADIESVQCAGGSCEI